MKNLFLIRILSSRLQRFIVLAILSLCGVVSLGAADETMEWMDLNKPWRTSGNAAIVVSNGLLQISYDDPQKEPFTVTAPDPVPLPDSVQYLSGWVVRLSGDFSIVLQIQDAKGVVHELPVQNSRPGGGAVGWQQSRCRQWSIWHQIVSYNLSTPEGMESRFAPEQLEAVKALVWPRPLALAGIIIKPAKAAGWDVPEAAKEVKAGKGKLMLSGLRLVTKPDFDANWSWNFLGRLRQGSDELPPLFPDDLSELSGPVRYAVELCRGYQGPVIWQEQGVKIIDRSQPMALFENRITLPPLPPGRYFLSTKTWKPDGTLDAERLMLELLVLRNESQVKLKTLPVTFGWESGRDHHVFPAGTATASLRVTSDSALWKSLPIDSVHVSIIDYNRRPVFEKTYLKAEAVTVELPVQPSGEYFAVAELIGAGGVYDRAHVHFGVATAPEEIARRSVPREVPTRDEFLNGRVHFTAEYWIGCRSGVYPWVNPIDRNVFDEWIGQAVRSGATTICVGDLWGNHEMLPGVMQWSELDREIALARQHGLKVFLAYTADGASRCFPFPLWLEAQPQLNQYGKIPFGVFRPSYWDESVRKEWQEYFRKLAMHVLDNPDVVGYRLENYALAGKTLGWGVDSFRIDYSAAAQRAFDQWQISGKRTAHPLTRLFSLPGVMDQDLPGPDLSPGFREFMDFNNHTMRTRTREIFGAIRSVDSKRQIQLDEKPFSYAVESAIPILRDGGVLKNEDSPNFNVAALRSMAVQAGVPYVEELHNHMPTSRSIADSVNFWSSYLSKGIFWLIRWNANMIVTEPPVTYPGAFNQKTEAWLLDYMKNSIPRWEEWVRADEAVPEVLVFGSRAQGLLGNSRTGGDLEIEGIKVFSTLFQSHQVPVHFADEYSDWVNLDRFKLVFVAGEVLPEQAIDRLEAYARAGGKIVLVGRAGKYCPEQPSERELLRKRLQSFPNVKSVSDPEQTPVSGQPSWVTVSSFPQQELEALLAWSGVRRQVTATGPQPGFECQLRLGKDKKTLYVAIMRRWSGWYPDNIEREAALEKKYGRAACRVTIESAKDGLWKVQQFHRDEKEFGVIAAKEGRLSFETEPMLAGEVQLYRIVLGMP